MGHPIKSVKIRNVSYMWCYKTQISYLLLIIQSFLKRNAKEGDSPVEKIRKELWVSWVVYIGNCAQNWEASTSNPKYVLSPIAY